MTFQIILVIHVLLALGLVGLILIQHGKGADAGAERAKQPGPPLADSRAVALTFCIPIIFSTFRSAAARLRRRAARAFRSARDTRRRRRSPHEASDLSGASRRAPRVRAANDTDSRARRIAPTFFAASSG